VEKVCCSLENPDFPFLEGPYAALDLSQKSITGPFVDEIQSTFCQPKDATSARKKMTYASREHPLVGVPH
jgi:hypothetical protein